MIEPLGLRFICIVVFSLMLVLFGFLERKTGIPFISNSAYLTVIIITLLGLIIGAFIINGKNIKEEEEDNSTSD